MTNQFSKSQLNFDRLSAMALLTTLLATIGLYFVFYMPAITSGIKYDVLLDEGILWLEIHIAAYWISYSLYFMGFLLAFVNFLSKAAPRFPWIEAATLIATFLVVIGLITGILYSKPAWNAWWVWDAKHTVALLNTMFLVGISPFVVLTRKFSSSTYRNGSLVILLFAASVSCLWSLLIGFFTLNIHPQWFTNFFG